MNVTTWNQFGTSEVLLACLGMVGFLSVVAVVVTASGRVNKREMLIRSGRRLQNLEPEESVFDDTRFGGTDPD
jgi:hypothetical protein